LAHSDRRIAKRLLAGDESAFNALFESYFPRLYRWALARLDGDVDEARDLVQATFCKAFERIDTYRGEASLYGWMCQIMRNALIDRGRRRKHEAHYVDVANESSALSALAESLRVPDGEPETEARRTELVTLIQVTLDHLPTHYGDVLELKYVDELSVNDIAAKLGMGQKAAESLLTRARVAFREAIVAISGSAELLPSDLGPSSKR
jgi:RNA polymerase sigma-70 factor (ECF subfamily)